jgi:hypothetical protein
MKNPLGNYVRESRLLRGWSYGDVARALSYKNLNKGMRRLQRLEDGIGDPEFLERVIAALDLDVMEVNRRIDEDIRRGRLEFNEWADEPSEPVVLVNVLSGIMANRSLEGATTQMEIFEQARKISRQFGGRPTYLVVSRRLTFVFRNGDLVRWKEGKPSFSTLPFTIISGRACQITLGP